MLARITTKDNSFSSILITKYQKLVKYQKIFPSQKISGHIGLWIEPDMF